MVAHTIFKGTIRFKDLEVPVRFHAAVRRQRVGFRLLHKPDKVRLEQRMYCAEENKPVGRDHQALGYEVSRGQYVVLDPEEVKDARPETDRTIDVTHFVKDGEIDPRFYDRPYYLAPDGKEGAYALVVRALAKSGHIAVCRWAMRRRAHIGFLQPLDDVLLITTMRPPQELMPTGDIEVEHPKLKRKELKTAKRLIEEMAADFDPGAYADEHHQAVLELVERKAKGEKPKTRRARRKKATSPGELQEMLEKSLERAKAA